MLNPLPISRKRGVSLPSEVVTAVLASEGIGSTEKRAKSCGVSTSSIKRIDKNMRDHGQPTKPSKVQLHNSILSGEEKTNLCWFKLHQPGALRSEVIKFLKASTKIPTISTATISNEYKRLGFTRQVIHYFSSDRDESDRVAYHVNGVDHPVRPGIRGVDYRRFVDIDEGGRYSSESERRHGHGLKGIPLKKSGRSHRDGKRLSFAVAVDVNKGSISDIIYPKGTTNEKFYLWLRLNVLPKIADTPGRVIVMDNLDSHCTAQIKELIERNGHFLVLRPIHSPDFGGVEWVFSYVDFFFNFALSSS